jgi:predicted dienelactone hydrolase
MTPLVSILRDILATLVVAIASTCIHAAGFQRGLAADSEGKPLAIGIWYPSSTAATPLVMGVNTIVVAVNAPVEGNNLPLIVISHGNGGSYLSHFDTAIALADAGFVVVAVTHTGDNYADQSRATFIMERPRHLSRAIDHMLSTWDGHAAIDPGRIAAFGHSSGGFTVLASIGGLPDFSKIGPLCVQYPGDYACQLIARNGGSSAMPPASASAGADSRIKSAVVASPALGFTYSPDGLKNVRVPLQLWHAERDVIVPHPRYTEAVRLALPLPPDYQFVPNAGHFDFLAPCSSALAAVAASICASPAGFDRAAFHTAFNAALITFYRKTLETGSKT